MAAAEPEEMTEFDNGESDHESEEDLETMTTVHGKYLLRL